MKVVKCLYCSGSKLSKVTHRLDGVDIIKCSHCDLMMVGEISDNTEQMYTSDYFEKNTETKNGYSTYMSSPVGNLMGKYAFTKLISPAANEILDLGCADGSLLEIFKSEGFSARGLEISKDAVSVAVEKGLDVSFSNLHSFPVNQPHSDLITAFDLLEHVDKLKGLLESVFDNLNDDGMFCFSTLLVKKEDSSDYWFNNSLEHYIYFDEKNLNKIFTDIFGDGRFRFIEVVVNGISEVWGFAKKGNINNDESKILETIKKRRFNKNNPDQGYLLSLLYNQVSSFDESLSIIDYFKDIWSASLYAQASFYHNFYQGKLEKAVLESKNVGYLISASSVYWQALCNAERVYYEILSVSLAEQANRDILSLREQLFDSRDQLNSLRNSRIIGRLIRLRNFLGRRYHNLKVLPGRIAAKLRLILVFLVPSFIRKPIMYVIRHDFKSRIVKNKIIVNKKWEKGSPIVSVVIPYYKRFDTIDDTLNSLDGQTFIGFETILVNDGTPDEASINKIDELKKNRPNLIVLNQVNQGVAKARNNGVSLAKGKYIICLDSDDILMPTFIEKALVVMETNPEISVVSSFMETFGVKKQEFRHVEYNPVELFSNNMVITAAAYRKKAWKVSGGYKSNIGYEDWEYWINLAKHGFWGKLIPEVLFGYRIAMQSRYIEDKDVHWDNIKKIHSLHSNYKNIVRGIMRKRSFVKKSVDINSAFINLNNKLDYKKINDNKNILIFMPWMTFGGAETLVFNFCNEIKNIYNIHFMTGLKSENEWGDKFKEVTDNIYHLPNLFSEDKLYLEFISNYIETRSINVLHIIHTDFAFSILPEIKKRHPEVKVIITMFNDRVVNYFQPSIDLAPYVDLYTSDNLSTSDHFKKLLPINKPVKTVPNGVDCISNFNPILFNRQAERGELGLADDDLAVFFVGRLSSEKNPDVFLDSADSILNEYKINNIKFFIIGDGNMRKIVEERIASLGGSAVYLGYQSKVAKYLSAADVFVLPSSIEGFPLSILEAMAMRVVVIASEVGAVSDVISDKVDGYVVKAGSADQIVKNIIKLNKNRVLLEKNKVLARSKLEKKYSNEILKSNYVELYRDILS